MHKILRLRDLKRSTGLSRSAIHMRISQGTFPRPVFLGGRAVGWLESKIQGWLQQRIESEPQSRGKNQNYHQEQLRKNGVHRCCP
jgi:prophage regulatory protein